jgi:dinuclear metal center YbgI/SA1388 family protein
MPALTEIVAHLDSLLRPGSIPDYPGALNGLQFENSGTVTRVAAAVDFSLDAVRAAAREGANLLVVHHGMFWGGTQRLTGLPRRRLQLLVEHDIAVYASHIPLDLHAEFGNNVLLAAELGLRPGETFGEYQGIRIGVRGFDDLATDALVQRAADFVAPLGGTVRTTRIAPGRRTRQWAMVTGAGASPDTIRESLALGVDTLIVGEGAHHTAVEANDLGLAIIYAGHYATETVGVRALAAHLHDTFAVPWSFLDLPTGM